MAIRQCLQSIGQLLLANRVCVVEWATGERRESEPEDSAQIAVGRRLKDAFLEAADGLVDEQQYEALLHAPGVDRLRGRAVSNKWIWRSLRLRHDSTQRPRHVRWLWPDVKASARFATRVAARDKVRDDRRRRDAIAERSRNRLAGVQRDPEADPVVPPAPPDR